MKSKAESQIIVKETLQLTNKDFKTCDDCNNGYRRTPSDKDKVMCKILQQYNPYKCTCDMYDVDFNEKYDKEVRCGIISPDNRFYSCKYSEHRVLSEKLHRLYNLEEVAQYEPDSLLMQGFHIITYLRGKGYILTWNKNNFNIEALKLFLEEYKNEEIESTCKYFINIELEEKDEKTFN